MQRVPEPREGQVEAVVRQHVHVGRSGTAAHCPVTALALGADPPGLLAGATHSGRAAALLTV